MCPPTTAEITGGEQRSFADDIDDLCSKSMSFDDDIEVLEEYETSLNTTSCEPVSTIPIPSQPMESLQTRGKSSRRRGINFQWPLSARKNSTNSKPRHRVPLIRHEVDANGYCIHHPDIQLYRRGNDASDDWRVVRKKCPICTSKDCPVMLSEAAEKNCSKDKAIKSKTRRQNSFVQSIVTDFSPDGDQKILRAIGRTATVNAAVLLTAATGGVGASAVGYATGGAITAKRLSEGVAKKDDKEITKSLAVFGAATGASIAGQALTGALMIGVAGASLPVAGAVAFGVGCASGISAGALSEWSVDGIMDKRRKQRGQVKETRSERDDEGCQPSREDLNEGTARQDSCV